MRECSADVVVVGAGVAGCVMARRLADRGYDVLLLDAGTHRAPEEAGVMAIGPGSDVVTRYDAGGWGTGFALPRGRTPGGSGAVNGGYCLPAPPEEFAAWPNPSWEARYRAGLRRAWERLRPETSDPGPVADLVDAAFPGTRVPVPQARRGERRWTAMDAWDPVGAGARLVTGARVDRVRDRRVSCADGRSFDADHVVLCAGTLGTTEILFRSGLGEDPALEVGVRAREHPEILLDLETGVTAASDSPRSPILPAVNRLVLESRLPHGRTGPAVIEIRPYEAPFSDVVPGAPQVPHRIGVALMNPRGHSRVSYRLGADDGSPGSGLRIRLDDPGSEEGRADDRDLAEAAELVRDALGLSGPTIRSTSQHLAATARVGTTVDARGRVFGTEWLWIADASMHADLPTVGPYVTVAAIAEALAESFPGPGESFPGAGESFPGPGEP